MPAPRSRYGLLAPLWASFLLGCLSAPEPADWLAVGFRTPEETFRTFQTALRADQPDLEYRCLGRTLKANQIRSQTFYREWRAKLFREQPWLKLVAWAEVVEVRPLPGGGQRLVAEVDTWFHDRTFAVDFLPESYYEVWGGTELLTDDFFPFARWLASSGGELVLTLPTEGAIATREVTEIRAGTQWKISGFPSPEGQQPPALPSP